MASYYYFNRDLSWLSFNERVMGEAADDDVPLLERVKFLGIFSSNLDEFYRVRMPVLNALNQIGQGDITDISNEEQFNLLKDVKDTIKHQQIRFGRILTEQLIPSFKKQNIHLLYNEPLPSFLEKEVDEYFLSEVLAFLQPVSLINKESIFLENNKLYFIVQTSVDDGREEFFLLNIPSDELQRFFLVKNREKSYVVFLDDVIRHNLARIFKGRTIKECFSIKVTRDAELDLKDEYPGDISAQIGKQLKKRDLGLATRFLYQSGIPLRILQWVIQHLDFQYATITEGGRYHNLKDLNSFPAKIPDVSYTSWPAIKSADIENPPELASLIAQKDFIVHTPYQSYHAVLRFFNEAAINPDVTDIYITLYRVANDSRIVNALISAAKNGKKVQVIVELKARFDEANNLKWAQKMKEAGVKIIYSVTALKVHAKIALIKTRKGNRIIYSGLLATGNFNELTARFYTDHILFTSNPNLLREMELLFIFLSKREKPSAANQIEFRYLLVAQFNLKTRFIELIDKEIDFARQGQPARIVLKMNNLEERALINKLYEASQAGVKISLIVRSICCLVPGIKGMSENIVIHRIVDRYLEHGRIFVFNNNGDPDVYLGSADWMNRNIHHRIEVCFPVYDEKIKREILSIIDLQLKDNLKGVYLDQHMKNEAIESTEPFIQAQQEIYRLLSL
jgi:polyphosphate kinase